LVCSIGLIVLLSWSGCVQGTQYTQVLRTRCGRCGFLAHFLQPYFVAGIFLLWFFVHTFRNVIQFEYINYGFLDPDRYSDNLNPNITYIGLSDDELNGSALTIPGWLRWISVLSPVASVLTFGVAGFQTLRFIFRNGIPESTAEAFLHRIIVGMPLVFATMATRATIREWAVMTGSAWTQAISDQLAGASLMVRQEKWGEIKALQMATYEQNLQVASAFQFFAVGCFTQLCSEALKAIVTHNPNNVLNRRLTIGTQRSRLQRDSFIVRCLALGGLWLFAFLGILKAVVTLVIGMITSDRENVPLVQPIYAIMKMLNPVFVFATVLSVIYMTMLGKMDVVKNRFPGANIKFHATRALLLIGQVQFSVLQLFITTNGTSPLSHALHNITTHGTSPFLHKIERHSTYPDFGIHQARLLHSSLLCFECLIVAIVNLIVWNRERKGFVLLGSEGADLDADMGKPVLAPSHLPASP